MRKQCISSHHHKMIWLGVFDRLILCVEFSFFCVSLRLQRTERTKCKYDWLYWLRCDYINEKTFQWAAVYAWCVCVCLCCVVGVRFHQRYADFIYSFKQTPGVRGVQKGCCLAQSKYYHMPCHKMSMVAKEKQSNSIKHNRHDARMLKWYGKTFVQTVWIRYAAVHAVHGVR